MGVSLLLKKQALGSIIHLSTLSVALLVFGYGHLRVLHLQLAALGYTANTIRPAVTGQPIESGTGFMITFVNTNSTAEACVLSCMYSAMNLHSAAVCLGGASSYTLMPV